MAEAKKAAKPSKSGSDKPSVWLLLLAGFTGSAMVWWMVSATPKPAPPRVESQRQAARVETSAAIDNDDTGWAALAVEEALGIERGTPTIGRFGASPAPFSRTYTSPVDPFRAGTVSIRAVCVGRGSAFVTVTMDGVSANLGSLVCQTNPVVATLSTRVTTPHHTQVVTVNPGPGTHGAAGLGA